MKLKINNEYAEVSFFSFFKFHILAAALWFAIMTTLMFLLGTFLVMQGY